MKIKKIVGRSLKTIWGLGVAYAFGCLLSSVIVESFPGEALSYDQAQKIICAEQKQSYFDNEKINLMALPNNDLKKTRLAGFYYSSNGEDCIVFNENAICEKTLLHELGHCMLNKSRKGVLSLERCLDYAKANYSKETPGDSANPVSNTRSAGEIFKYFFSPEELFCNTYAIVMNGSHDLEDKE